MTEPTKSLAAALVSAQASAQAVEKKGRNQAMRYNFASAEGLIQEARDALASAGLALVATRWDVKWVETRSSLIVEYLLVHVSGETMKFSAETAIVPGNGRPQDKAEASALTFSLGYFLRSLLLLPRVEEGSQVDERKDDVAKPPTEPTLEQKLTWSAELAEAQTYDAIGKVVSKAGGTAEVRAAANKRVAELGLKK